MAITYNPRIVTDGLTLALDAGNVKSYINSGITYVGGASDSDNSSTFTLSGLQSGDLVLYFSAEDSTPVATPTGASWTAIPGLSTQPDNDGNPNSAAFYVFATGTSVTASGLNTGDEQVRVMIAFRNVNSTNPFDVNATENSGSNLPNPPSITPVTDNCMIVAVGLLDDHAIANSISPPTGYTTAVNMDSDGGANDINNGAATIMTAYKLLATAAAEDPSGFTGTTGDPNKGISIALRPGPVTLTWTDLIGSNNGTLTNGPTFSLDNGGAFEFDGTNDYINCGSSSDFAFGEGDFSIEMWWYSDNTQTNLTGLLSLSNANAANNWQLGPGSTDHGSSNTQIVFTGGSHNADPEIVDPTNYTNQVWTNTVVTRTSGTIKMYSNGVSVGSISDSSNFSSTGPLKIGVNRGDNKYWSGKISNVKLYKGKGLTAAEVQQNFNAARGRYGI